MQMEQPYGIGSGTITGGVYIGGSATVSVPKVTPLDELTKKVEQARMQIDDARSRIARVSDVLLGTVPEPMSGQANEKGIGGRPGMIGHLNDQCDMLLQSVADLQNTLTRLGAF